MKNRLLKVILPLFYFLLGLLFLVIFIVRSDFSFELPKVEFPKLARVKTAFEEDVKDVGRTKVEKKRKKKDKRASKKSKSKDLKNVVKDDKVGLFLLSYLDDGVEISTRFASFKIPKIGGSDFVVKKFKSGFEFLYGVSSENAEKEGASLVFDESGIFIENYDFANPVFISCDFSEREDFPLISAPVFKYKKFYYVLTAFNGAEIGESQIVFSGKDSFVGIEATKKRESVFNIFYNDGNSIALADSYKKVVSDFFESGYKDLLTDRLSSNSNLWDGAVYKPTIISMLFSIYSRERALHNNFPEAKLIAIAKKNRNKLSFENSIFVGDVVRREEAYYSSLSSVSPRYRRKLETSDYSVFKNSRSLYNSIFLTKDVNRDLVSKAILSVKDFDNLSISELNGILEIAVKLGDSAFENVCNDISVYLLSSLKKESVEKGDLKIDSGKGLYDCFYLNNGDLYETIRFAQNLVYVSRLCGNKSFAKIGKTLIVKIFSMKEGCFLKSKRGDVVYPEDVYRFFFFRDLPEFKVFNLGGKEYIVYSDNKNLALSLEGRNLTLKSEKEQDSTSNIVIYGVKSFKDYFMYGRSWARDWNYQNYYGGAYYNKNREILYIKLKQKSSLEEVKVVF